LPIPASPTIATTPLEMTYVLPDKTTIYGPGNFFF